VLEANKDPYARERARKEKAPRPIKSVCYIRRRALCYIERALNIEICRRRKERAFNREGLR